MTKKQHKAAVIQSLYGYEKPIVGASFSAAPLLRRFLQDYNALIHSQKKISVTNHSNSFHYYCHDKIHCSWHVRATKKKYPSKKKNNNNELNIIKITHVHNVHSKDCTSKAGPKQYDSSLKRAANATSIIPTTTTGRSMMQQQDDDYDDNDDDEDDEDRVPPPRPPPPSEFKKRRGRQKKQKQDQPPSDDIDTLLREVAASEQNHLTTSTTKNEEGRRRKKRKQPPQQEQDDDDDDLFHDDDDDNDPQQPDSIMSLVRSMEKNVRHFETRLTKQVQTIQSNMIHKWQRYDAIAYNRRHVRCGTDTIRSVPNDHGIHPTWFPKTLNELLFATKTNHDILFHFYEKVLSDNAAAVTSEQKRIALRRYLGLPY